MKKKGSASFYARFAIAAAVFGSMAGPGNASGTTILHFFTAYGWSSAWMPLVSFGLMAIGMYWMLEYQRPTGKIRYNEVFADLYGDNIISKILVPLLDIVVVLGAISSMCLVMAQSGAVAESLLGINKWYGILVIAGVGFLAGMLGTKAFEGIQTVLSSVMLVVFFVILIYGITKGNAGEVIAARWVPEGASTYNRWFWGIGSGVAGMAFLAVMFPSNAEFKSSKDTLSTVILTFVLCCGIYMLSTICFLGYVPDILKDAVPMLTLAETLFSRVGAYFYVVLLAFAIITTMAGKCFTLNVRFEKYVPKAITNKYIRLGIPSFIILAIGVFVSSIGVEAVFNLITMPTFYIQFFCMFLPAVTMAPYKVIKRRKALAAEATAQ